MIWQRIDVDGYWLMTVVYVPDEAGMAAVGEALERLGCPQADIARSRRLLTEEWNKGFTWSNPARRRSITVIGRAKSWSEFFNTVMHEVKHVVDEIVGAYDVMNYGEAPAYLQGEIGRQMAPVIRRLACPCCLHGTGWRGRANTRCTEPGGGEGEKGRLG